nr:uncharacterized protein LOC101942300 [Chrysemys picta bellii]
MQDKEGDTGLDPWPQRGSLSAAGNQAADPEPPTLPVPAPCRHRHCLVALGAGCISLTLAVIVLSRVVSHLASKKGPTPAAPDCEGAGSRDTATPPGSDGAGSRDPSTVECSARLERVRSQLCPPAPPGPAGGSGCKLCPLDWQLRGDKCYWVSRGSKTWNASRVDCSARGSQLLVIWDQEELEFLKDLTQGSQLFWIGLSISSSEKAWTWLDGSRLDQTHSLQAQTLRSGTGRRVHLSDLGCDRAEPCGYSLEGFQGCCQEHQTTPASRGPEDVGDAQSSGNGAEGCCSLQDFRSHLRQSLCELPQSSSAEGSGCKLCPRHWVPHRDKCYWLSEEDQYWSRGRDDCSRRRSHLLVIQDREELSKPKLEIGSHLHCEQSSQRILPCSVLSDTVSMSQEFTQNITGNQNPVWIGLNITSPGKKWTWVDGSPLNQMLFTVSGPAEENSCAAVKKNQIKSEICITHYKWICQKEAVRI